MNVQPDRLAHLVEEIAVHFDAAGMPPMAGRVLGHLLICDPPEQTSADLQDALGASKGSISMTTSLLVRGGLVDRTRLPGDRRHYYLIRPGMWSRLMQDQVEQVRSIRETVERGIDLLADEAPSRRARLEEMRAFYAFYQRELPALVERWRTERRAKVA